MPKVNYLANNYTIAGQPAILIEKPFLLAIPNAMGYKPVVLMPLSYGGVFKP